MKSAIQETAGLPAFGRIGIVFLLGTSGFLLLALASQSPLLMAGVLVVFGCLALMLRWPEVGTLVALFAIYSNVGVLAMRAPNAVELAAGPLSHNPRVALVLGALSLLLSVPLLHQIFICKRRLIFGSEFALMALFLAVLLASSVFARDVHTALPEIADYFVEGLLLYFVVINLIRDFPTLRRATWTLLLAGSFMAGVSVVQKVTHTEHNTYGGLGQVESDFRSNPRMPNVVGRTAVGVSENGEVAGQLRSAGPIGETNRYGQILLVLLPLAVLQFATERPRRLRILALIAAGLILGGLLLTFSRGNLLAAIVTFGLMACLGLLKPRQFLGAALGVSLLTGVFQPGIVSRMLTLERLKPLFSGAQDSAEKPDSSAIRRYVENVSAWRVFCDHPVLGVGPGHFAAYYSNDYGNRLGLVEQTEGYRAHNLYLETLAENGAVGFTCFLSILFVTMRGLWKARSRLLYSHPELACTVTAFFVSLSAYAISAVFAHLSYQRYFWLLLALACAAIRIVNRKYQEDEISDLLLSRSEA